MTSKMIEKVLEAYFDKVEDKSDKKWFERALVFMEQLKDEERHNKYWNWREKENILLKKIAELKAEIIQLTVKCSDRKQALGFVRKENEKLKNNLNKIKVVYPDRIYNKALEDVEKDAKKAIFIGIQEMKKFGCKVTSQVVNFQKLQEIIQKLKKEKRK